MAHLLQVVLPTPERSTGRGGGAVEYRIDDLARAAGMTTRNVRAYQDRGLLPAPRRSGRVALYDDRHLARLKLIGSMLGRGYTTAHIAEMLEAWESGKDLAAVLGLEETLSSPWSDDRPTSVPTAEVRRIAGDSATMDRLTALGLIKPKGTRTLVVRPQLLAAFEELRGVGIPTEQVIALYESISPNVDAIASALVRAAAAHVTSVKGPRWVPTGSEIAELTELITRFRRIALTTVQQSVAAALEQSVAEVLGEYVADLNPA